MRQGDAGVGKRLLLGGRDACDVAEGGDLDGPADAGAPQRLRDARGEVARVGAAREAAPLEVPPHRHLHRLGLLPVVLLLLLLLQLLVEVVVVALLRADAAPGSGCVGGRAAEEDAVVGGSYPQEKVAGARGDHGGGARSPWRRVAGGFSRPKDKTLVGWAWAGHTQKIVDILDSMAGRQASEQVNPMILLQNC